MMEMKEFGKVLEKQEEYLRETVYDRFYWWIVENPIQCLPVVLRYHQIIDGNFLEWLTKAMSRSKNDVAKEIIRKNLLCEVQDNHQKLLKDWFEGMMTAYQALVGFQETQVYVDELQKNSNDSYHLEYFGLNVHAICDKGYAVVIIALLEQHSRTFIRLFSELAKKLGYSDSSESMIYLKVHGEADAKHAHDALIAVSNELTDCETHQFMLKHASSTIVNLLEYIFTTPKFE